MWQEMSGEEVRRTDRRWWKGWKKMKGIYSKMRKKKSLIWKKEGMRWTEQGKEREELAAVSPCWLSGRMERRIQFSNTILSAGCLPSPTLQPCKHASDSILETHTHTEIKLKTHMELLPHMHTTSEKHHAGTPFQKTHKHTGRHSQNTKSRYMFFSLAITPQWKHARHFRWVINCVVSRVHASWRNAVPTSHHTKLHFCPSHQCFQWIGSSNGPSRKFGNYWEALC